VVKKDVNDRRGRHPSGYAGHAAVPDVARSGTKTSGVQIASQGLETHGMKALFLRRCCACLQRHKGGGGMRVSTPLRGLWVTVKGHLEVHNRVGVQARRVVQAIPTVLQEDDELLLVDFPIAIAILADTSSVS
jgi:hypothetical protein